MKNQDERGHGLYAWALLAVLVMLAAMLVDSLKQGEVGMAIFLAAGVLAVLFLIYVGFILPLMPEKKSKANKQPPAARKQSEPEKAQPQSKPQSAGEHKEKPVGEKRRQTDGRRSTNPDDYFSWDGVHYGLKPGREPSAAPKQATPEKAQPQQAAAVHTTGKNMKGKFEVSCHEAAKEKDGKTLHRLFHVTEYHSEDGMVGEEINVWYSNDTGKPVYYLEQSLFDGGNMWGNRALGIKAITGEEMRTMAERYSVPVHAITPASKKEEIKEPDAAVVNAFREKILQYCDDKVKDSQKTAAMSAFEKEKQYIFHSVVLEKARACVPGGPCGGWDGVDYRLDLENHSLSVHCSSYPALYGSPPEWTFSITPEKFHETAEANGFPAELLTFRTQIDWDELFNDELNEAIAHVQKAVEKAGLLTKRKI